MAMQTRCVCGEVLAVRASQAGCRVACRCGRALEVPPLGEFGRSELPRAVVVAEPGDQAPDGGVVEPAEETAGSSRAEDLDIWYARPQAGFFLLGGVVMALFGGAMLAVGGEGMVFGGVFFCLIGVGVALISGYKLLDNVPKLSLTGEGLRDHRSGSLIRWSEIESVELSGERETGVTTAAYLLIRLAGRDPAHPVAVDVAGLDHSAEEIHRLVLDRVDPVVATARKHRFPPG